MENQAPYIRHHVSECPLPEIPETAVFKASYVVAAPDGATCTPQHVKQAADELVRAAGLPAMGFSAYVSDTRHGYTSIHLMGYDRDGLRNPLDVHAISVVANSLDELLRRLATSLLAWATKAGLLYETSTNAGEELVCA